MKIIKHKQMTNKEKFLNLVSKEKTKTVERAKERLKRKYNNKKPLLT